MQIKTIEFEYGLTVNLGNYSNAKPIVRMTAELDENDDAYSSLDWLINVARQRVQAIADDELEQSGNEVRYSGEPLYQVRYSELRKCVVVAPANLDLPKEKTWRDSDSWGYGNDRYPRHMRYTTAVKPATSLSVERGFELIAIHYSHQLDKLPPLPDPGPEPVWHTKQLRPYFQHLDVPESQWEELAALDHVTDSFLQQVHRWRSDWKNRHSVNQTMILDIIRTGLITIAEQPAPTPDDGDSSYPRGDEGWGDGDDEDEDEDTDE